MSYGVMIEGDDFVARNEANKEIGRWPVSEFPPGDKIVVTIDGNVTITEWLDGVE